ncbi:MAG: hypothetical protein JWQ97_1627 [Phenylobacterium sp.]|nr:hypothetical protein [Phenylobacterium sp.]
MSSVVEAEIPAMAATTGGLTPYLNVDGALAAAEFYKKAFGATVAALHPADDKGRTMHVHLHIAGSSVMLSDFYPEHGHAKVDPQAFTLVLTVDDIQAAFQRAVDAGAEVTQPVSQMFWGDLYGAVRDPFGVSWAMNQPQG